MLSLTLYNRITCFGTKRSIVCNSHLREKQMKALCMDNIVDLEAAFMLQAEQIDVCARA